MEPTMDEKLKAVIELCEAGDAETCAWLGKEFYFGWNIEQDLNRALRYLTTAAESGDAISQFLVGFMHWSGRGTEPNRDEALRKTCCLIWKMTKSIGRVKKEMLDLLPKK